MNIFLPLLIACSLTVPQKPISFNSGTFKANLNYPGTVWIEIYKFPAGTMEDEVCDLVNTTPAVAVSMTSTITAEFEGEGDEVIAVLDSIDGCETPDGFYEDFFTQSDYLED